MSISPIGIFDSGFGGLTVMKAIRTLLPHENIIYFGDTARLPYGTKSRETIIRYSEENATFLQQQGIKVLVVACHTACSFALEKLQQKFELPILGVTASSIEPVVHRSPRGKISILGTRGTIASGAYQSAIQLLLPAAEISPIACQMLVHLVEEGFIDHPITEMTIREYLEPLKNKDIDTLVLGCTHFPLLHHQIQKAVSPHVQVIDPAQFCAEALQKLLTQQNLLNPEKVDPYNQFFVSDDPEKFRLMGKNFLGQPLSEVKHIEGASSFLSMIENQRKSRPKVNLTTDY
jgi:glutamate racemase